MQKKSSVTNGNIMCPHGASLHLFVSLWSVYHLFTCVSFKVMFLKKKKNPVLNSTWYFCDKLQFSPTIMTWYLLVSLVGTFLLYLKLSGKSDYGCFVPHLKFRNLEYNLIALKIIIRLPSQSLINFCIMLKCQGTIHLWNITFQ